MVSEIVTIYIFLEKKTTNNYSLDKTEVSLQSCISKVFQHSTVQNFSLCLAKRDILLITNHVSIYYTLDTRSVY